MTDREKLIELVRGAFHKCLSVVCRDCEEYDPDAKVSDRLCQYRLFSDHLLANGVTFATDNHVGGKWIPVTERLPEKGTYLVCKAGFGGARYLDVLSFVEDLYRLDEYDFRHYAGQKKAGFVYYDSEYGYYDVDSVTHWMPLPEPPADMRKESK